MQLLKSNFFERDTLCVAQELLGKILVKEDKNCRKVAVISEVEAYKAENDPASHCYNGLTKRNKTMFGPVGHLYVYLSYGLHHCMNIVAKDKNSLAGGILLRSIIPIEGFQTIKIDGPGKITKNLEINLAHDGAKLSKESGIYILDHEPLKHEIIVTPRIGISKGKDLNWRFLLEY